MKDKISIPNPLSILTNMEPSTKKWLIAVIGAVIITAMVTGNFDTLVGIFTSEGKK